MAKNKTPCVTDNVSGLTKSLQLVSVQLKHFRCFDQRTFELDSPVVLIQGVNGVGKTSLLEALHYACYLRSFRSHLPRDLIAFNNENFFVKVQLRDNSFGSNLEHHIQVGFAGAKRLVKVNQKAVSSYKELMQHYRVVSLTEDDLALVKGSPQIRRTFLDQAILLSDPDFISQTRDFRTVLENRNTMLKSGRGIYDHDLYLLWTQQLWERSKTIQCARKKSLYNSNTKLILCFLIILTMHFQFHFLILRVRKVVGLLM